MLNLILLLLHFLTAIAEPLNSFTFSSSLSSGSQGPYPIHRFRTSKVVTAQVNFVHHSPACQDGLYYFLAPRGWKVSTPGPMILDENGTLIWSQHFKNDYGGQAYDLRVQKYRGEDVLTFWTGDDRIRGHGAGHYFVLDSSYNIIRKVGAANGKFADLHEFIITPEGTAILIVFEVIKTDTRPLGRKFNDLWNQAMWDCLFQEIDIETGEAIFEWRASEYVNMTDTYNTMETADQGTNEQPFDWSHLNSVEKDDLGNYLVSIRNTHSIVYIDGKTREVLWSLGGKSNSFQDLSGGHAINFAWQHYARWVPASAFKDVYTPPRTKKGVTTKLMTVFDNAALDWNHEYGPEQTRVMLLEVTYPTTMSSKARREAVAGDEKTSSPLSELDASKVSSIDGTNPIYTARLIKEYLNPASFLSGTQGNAQLLPPTKTQPSRLVVGYGINAVNTIFHTNGTVACDWHFAARSTFKKGDVQNYRTYKFPWIGRPTQPPSIALSKTHVFVSWNGATEVHSYRLQTHPIEISDQGWQDVTTIPKAGFETEIPLTTIEYDVSKEVLRIQALDEKENLLENGISESIRRTTWGDSAKKGIDPRNGEWESLGVWSTISVAVLVFMYLQARSRKKAVGSKDLGHVD